MKYLTAKQIEALSPVKREVYEKRLNREKVRMTIELEEFPKTIPYILPYSGSIFLMSNARFTALTAAKVNALIEYETLIRKGLIDEES